MYSIGKLSKKTGVTIPTLDYYDEIGLIVPSSKTEGGHRLYDEDDVLRLEQVLALKYMGFSLQQVQEVLNESATNWEQSLEKQLLMIQEKKEHLNKIERTIEGVLYSVQFEGEVRWSIIFDMIHMFQKDTDMINRILESHFTSHEQKVINKLNEPTKNNVLYEWENIIVKVRENLDKDPGSEIAQSLAKEWMEKADSAFAGNKELEAKMWKAIKNNSEGAVIYPMDNKVVSFIDNAVKIMYKRENELN